ncbi:response regulator [Noviherbaspirillum sp. ST9]|uniref:response regulator n=1 Tax=Noviherbaspirillum sp. ST9 TaxID=3401606 RepID=UPI003B58B0C7
MHKHNEMAVAAGHDKNSTLAMGSLLAEMNHDIRTSMNGVRGILELLIDTGLTPSQQAYARTAQHNVDTLLESLERIVDMSLIETNSFRFNQAPFDLLQEVHAALAGKQESGRVKGLEVSITYPAPIRLHGDAARLRAALSALGDVALHCAAGEFMTLACSARYLPGGKCRIGLEAKIPQSSQNSARLASVLGSADPMPAGAGSLDTLGMAVCTRLVQMMKGTITIDQANPPATLLRTSIDLPIAADALEGTRVLVLATRRGQMAPAAATLARHGLQVDFLETAHEGLAAIDLAARNGAPYRVVVLEPHLGGMDAGVLGSAIKTNQAHRDTLIVLMDDAVHRSPRTDDNFAGSLSMSANAVEMEAALASLCMAGNGEAPSSSGLQGIQRKQDAAPDYSGYKILVADDNPVNQQVAARMLEKLGCKAAVAADGMQAIEMHTWNRFDLILMDCEMPVLDGLEATQRIRAAEGTERRTPIIALTACTGQGEQERCLAAGMDDFLSKPIRPQLLGDVLARWLPRAAAVTTNDATPCEDELDEVKEMFGADFSELASLYQNDGAPRLAAMREAAAAGDCAKLAKVAHAFGGSCASIGATGLSALSKTVETAAKAGSLESFEQRMDAIENEYRRVCGKLQSLLTP